MERIDAGVDSNGKVAAWRHRSVAPTIASTFKAGADHAAPFELGMGLVDNPFNIANLKCESGGAVAHTRIGWFRSVSNIPHAFAVQSMVAEIAAALGRDPKDVLLELIGPDRIVDPSKSPGVTGFWNYGDPFETYPIQTGRLRRVAELAAQHAGWGKPLPKGQGLGIAAHRSFLSYVATVVHVAVDDKGNLSLPRVDTAIDCGVHINPERIRSQIEGAAVMGLALTKNSQITFKAGRPEQSNFFAYSVRHTARLFRGDLGISRNWNRPVAGLLRERWPVTAQLMAVGILGGWALALERARERRWRAGAATVRPGTLQRDFRRDRQTHQEPAHRRSAFDLTWPAREPARHCRLAVVQRRQTHASARPARRSSTRSGACSGCVSAATVR